MANMFDTQPVNVLQALMAGEQSYKDVRGYRNEAEQKAAMQDAAGSFQGGDTRSAIARLMQGGNINGAAALANMELARTNQEYNMKRDDRDFGFRREEAQRAQGNTAQGFRIQERQFEGEKVPPGWTRTPAGGLEPIKNGPADPDYIRRVSEVKEKPRQMSITDITKLTEEGQKFADLGRFGSTFKPEYAGYKNTTLGNTANIAGRHLPESWVGKDMADGATWWQGYDRYKNVVRHELYGSALTKPETAAFERADITPGMTPAQITKNLALQQEIVTNGLKRKAEAMISAGYDPKSISAAYGVELPSIGVTATSRRQAPPAAGPPPAPSPQGAASGNIPQGAAALLRQNPNLRMQFDQKYGAGSSNQVLGD